MMPKDKKKAVINKSAAQRLQENVCEHGCDVLTNECF